MLTARLFFLEIANPQVQVTLLSKRMLPFAHKDHTILQRFGKANVLKLVEWMGSCMVVTCSWLAELLTSHMQVCPHSGYPSYAWKLPCLPHLHASALLSRNQLGCHGYHLHIFASKAALWQGSLLQRFLTTSNALCKEICRVYCLQCSLNLPWVPGPSKDCWDCVQKSSCSDGESSRDVSVFSKLGSTPHSIGGMSTNGSWKAASGPTEVMNAPSFAGSLVGKSCCMSGNGWGWLQ